VTKRTTHRWAVFLAAIIVVGGALYNEMRPPVIRTIPLPGDDAFTLRFSVSNPAFLTSMKNMDFSCVPLGSHAAPFALNVDIDLPPRAMLEYTCPLGNPGAVATTPPAGAKIRADYTRFSRRTQIWSGEWTWDPASRVWTETRSLN
jgi:hypothetical protein